MYFRASRGVSRSVGSRARKQREAAPPRDLSVIYIRFLRYSFTLVSLSPSVKTICTCVVCEKKKKRKKEKERLEDRPFFWSFRQSLGVQQRRRQAAAAGNTRRRRTGVRDTIQGNRAVRLFVVASITSGPKRANKCVGHGTRREAGAYTASEYIFSSKRQALKAEWYKRRAVA